MKEQQEEVGLKRELFFILKRNEMMNQRNGKVCSSVSAHSDIIYYCHILGVIIGPRYFHILCLYL